MKTLAKKIFTAGLLMFVTEVGLQLLFIIQMPPTVT